MPSLPLLFGENGATVKLIRTASASSHGAKHPTDHNAELGVAFSESFESHGSWPAACTEVTMITFASFPPPSLDNTVSYSGHYRQDEDMEIDLDSEYVEGSGKRLTYPGETITSSQAFMR